MKKSIFIFFVLVLLGNITSCQESTLKLKLSMSSANIVLGEPLYFTVTLCNEGNEAIQMAPGETEGDFSCHIFTRCPDGKIIEGVGAGIAGSRSCPAMPKEIVPPKECRKTSVVPFVSCLTTFNKPGKYELWMEYETSTGIVLSQLKRPISEEPVKYWKGRLRSDVCSLDVIEPTGTDRIAYEKWLKPYALREKSLANFFTGNGDTLLQDGTHQFKDVRLLEEIMRDYPTSTYAGYELYDHFPTLANAKLDVIENQEKALQNWCDRGQSQEKLLKRKQETLAELDSYANQVKKFLGCHPNFLYCNSLRKRLAVCLGLNGRVAEAMEQVELLSKGEGKEAEEAREFLGCIEGKKKMEAAPIEKSIPAAKEEK